MKEFTDIFYTTNIRNLDISNWEISFDMFEIFIKKCGNFLKVFRCSCAGSKKDLNILIQSTTELHSRILDSNLITDSSSDGIKNLKIVWN
jgi:hypothetical protein